VTDNSSRTRDAEQAKSKISGRESLVMAFLRLMARTVLVLPWLLLATSGSAGAAIVFVNQGGSGFSEAQETSYYPDQLSEVGPLSVPNTDTPTWGYSVPLSTLPGDTTLVTAASPAGNASASASFSTTTLFQNGNQFTGSLAASASAQTSGGAANGAANASYNTEFQLTSVYNYTLSIYSSGADATFQWCQPLGTGCSTFSGSGLNGSTTLIIGTIGPCGSGSSSDSGCSSPRTFYFDPTVTANASAELDEGVSAQNSLNYTLTLTPVPLPGSACLMIFGLVGLGAMLRNRIAA
jgi:hypothetical protein